MADHAVEQVRHRRQPDVRMRPHVEPLAGAEALRAHLVEEDERTDHLLPRRGQHAPHRETLAEIPYPSDQRVRYRHAVNDTNVPDDALDPRAAELLAEWFGDAWRTRPVASAWWFAADGERDRALQRKFGALVRSAANGELGAWSSRPRERLALILLLDQLPRNCFRGSAAAFATDASALAEARHGLAHGDDRALNPWERMFFYMPLQHAEDAAVQEQSVELYAQLAAEAPRELAETFAGTLQYARLHRDIVVRFGRFPHRNAILGRESTAAEREWLAAGAPDFGQRSGG